MKLTSIYISFAIVLLAYSCTSSEEQGHSHDPSDAHGHSHGPNTPHDEEPLIMTHLQAEKIGLEFGGFEQKNLSATIRANGVLELPPQNKASVGALMEGRVIRVYAKPGQYVKKGQSLALLQNLALINLQQQLAETEGELLFLDKEYERQKGLVDKDIVGSKQLEKIESERKIALAKKTAASAKLRLLGISPTRGGGDFSASFPVSSPISGYVKEIHVSTGKFVEPNTHLFELVDNHHIHIDLSIFERDLPHVSVGQAIDFALQSNPGRLMKARIFAIGKALDSDDGTIEVHAEIDNKNGLLLPGMYVEARIITQNREVQSLPEAAVLADKGLHYIFIKDESIVPEEENPKVHLHEDEIPFKKVQVLTRNRDIGYVEVSPMEKLAQDVQIVVKGAYFLMAESKKGEQASGHSH